MVGEILRKERKRLGLSVPDVTKEITVSKSYLYAVEKGEKIPSLLFIQKIGEYYGITGILFAIMLMQINTTPKYFGLLEKMRKILEEEGYLS